MQRLIRLDPVYPTRRVVTRSGRRIRGVLSCGPFESLLERDALLVLMADPRFDKVVPQPFIVVYEDGTRVRRHFPDVAATGENASVVIEVKFDDEAASPEVVRREILMRAIFAEHRRHYFVWPASAIRRQPRLENARLLYSYAAFETHPVMELMAVDLVSRCPGITASEVAGRIGSETLHPVYAMLGRRTLDFDRHSPLSKASRLWMPGHHPLTTTLPLNDRETNAG